ncbi:SAM-dependent methyltransferase, partial [Streptomyces griseolus]|nr:SAM-dependent methyltransferase [Streptomyces griseolus]
QHPAHRAPLTKMGRPRAAGHFAHYVGNFSGVADARLDLRVPWMNRDGIRECIPPAYTHHIGTQALALLAATGLGVAA